MRDSLFIIPHFQPLSTPFFDFFYNFFDLFLGRVHMDALTWFLYSFSFCLLIHLIHSYNTPALTLILRTVLLVFPQTYSCFYIRTTPFPKEALRRPLRFLLRETSRSQAAPIVQVHPILLTPPVRPNNAKEAYNRYSQEQDEPHKAPPQKR